MISRPAKACLLLGLAQIAPCFARPQSHRHGHFEEILEAPRQSLNSSDDAPLSILLPDCTPEDASPPVSKNFIGFAFEMASFPRYVLTRDFSETNQYTLNLIDAIMSRTGGNPIVRLGGTSGDYGFFLPEQEEPALPVAEEYTYQDIGGTYISPAYWDLTHRIPASEYIVQLPLAHTNISETLLWARTAVKHIGLDRIQALEPGNEPDLYPDPNYGPPDWQAQLNDETYVGNFTEYVEAIKANLSLPDAPFFQLFDVSATLSANTPRLNLEQQFSFGVNANNTIKQAAHHYYQTNGGAAADLGPGLMNHARTAAQLGAYKPSIDFLRANHPDIPFINSEVGNSLNRGHTYDYQATLGSALWQIDFQLYSMAIGIARIHWQQIMHSGYIMWLPVDSGEEEARTFSNFYAMPFVGDFIGKTEGKTRAAEVETGNEDVVAYAAFVDDVPVRVAVINFDLWDEEEEGGAERPAVTVALRVPEGVEEVTVDVVGSPEGAHADGYSITYAGSQWPYDNEGLEVKGVRDDSRTLVVEDGVVEVVVESSSAVLVHLVSGQSGYGKGS